MKSQFIEQVQLLMEIQSIKCVDTPSIKTNNYMWLCSRKPSNINKYWIPIKDEMKIRQCLNKITQEQEIEVLKKLRTYLDINPNTSPNLILELTLNYLNQIISMSFLEKLLDVQQSTFSRMSVIRNSLRKFSLISNNRNNNKKYLTAASNNEQDKPRRSVTFEEVPTVYFISLTK